MGFQDVFMIVDRAAYDALSLPALPKGIELPAGTDLAMESTRARVIEAHKQLMTMNERKRRDVQGPGRRFRARRVRAASRRKG